MKGYGLFTFIYLVVCKLATLYVSPKSRLLRLPIFLRNKRQIYLGSKLTTGVGCRFDSFSDNGNNIKIFFGDNVQVNDYVHIAAIEKVVIGHNVLIASKVFISDHNHGVYSGSVHSFPEEPPAARPVLSKPVLIEDNVWLGEFVSVLPGVSIGKGSIIGANSVVTTDIPSNSIAVGSPARVVKIFDSESGKWIKV